MSIWTSAAEPIAALNNITADANYHAEGEPTAHIDIATARTHHDHTRLSIWDDTDPEQVDVLLSPAGLRELHRILGTLIDPEGS